MPPGFPIKEISAAMNAMDTREVEQTHKRMVITLCGSSRFPEAHALAPMHLSLSGAIVLPLFCFGHADSPTGAMFLTSDGGDCQAKRDLDSLHFDKIAMSDMIFVVNPGNYLGESTLREIEWAENQNVRVIYMFPTRPH
jgi:hypothetical protein